MLFRGRNANYCVHNIERLARRDGIRARFRAHSVFARKFRKISRAQRDNGSRTLHTKEPHYILTLLLVFRETDYARASRTIESVFRTVWSTASSRMYRKIYSSREKRDAAWLTPGAIEFPVVYDYIFMHAKFLKYYRNTEYKIYYCWWISQHHLKIFINGKERKKSVCEVGITSSKK